MGDHHIIVRFFSFFIQFSKGIAEVKKIKNLISSLYEKKKCWHQNELYTSVRYRFPNQLLKIVL